HATSIRTPTSVVGTITVNSDVVYTDAHSPDHSTLTLHDALPICPVLYSVGVDRVDDGGRAALRNNEPDPYFAAQWPDAPDPKTRSEEHTSELQSQSNLVCRLLLVKKKHN